MRGLPGCYEFNAFVSQSSQVDPIEQPFSATEQHRRDRDMQFINHTRAKILLDRVRPAADPHIHSASRLACTVERLAYAACDEVERRAALHLDGWTSMMRQDESWNVIRRI